MTKFAVGMLVRLKSDSSIEGAVINIIESGNKVRYRTPYFEKEEMTYFASKNEEIYDPWYCEDEIQNEGFFYPYHGNKAHGFDPFKIYGKEKIAWFVEDILMRRGENSCNSSAKTREELLDEVEFFCRELNMEYPKGYSDNISDEELREFISCWSEYDPLADLK